MVNAKLLFAGIEGGATHSNIILVDGHGKVLASAEGPATNHWLVGIEECINRIKKLVNDVKAEAGLSPDAVIDGLGLCLSGCEQETTNKALEADLRKLCPNLADTIFVGSDTIGSLSTACRNGGVIVISGTGSNSLLMNPNGSTRQSGGWGHMLGDEGGAFWIASRAVKTLFEEEDNLCEAPHSPALLRKLIFEHFNLEDRFGMLPHFYSHFDKQHFASLTAKISKAASSGDELCIHLMKEAGYHLGRHVSSLSRNMDPVMFDTQRGLEVVCSGSVFKSWDLLKPGFVEGVKPRHHKDVDIPRYTLLRLEVTSAFGAIYQAAKKYNYDLPRDYSQNSDPLFFYDQTQSNGTNSTNGNSKSEESCQNGRCRHASGSHLKEGIKSSILTSSLNSLHIATHCV